MNSSEHNDIEQATSEEEIKQEPKPDDEIREQIKEEVISEMENAKSSKSTFIATISVLAIQHLAFLGTINDFNIIGWLGFVMGIIGVILLLITYKDKNAKQKMPPAKAVALTLLTIEMVLFGVPPLGSLGVVFAFMDAFGVFNKIQKKRK